MHDAVGIIRAIVRDQLRSVRIAELGVVTAVYPHEGQSDVYNCECDVKLRDSGLELKRVTVGVPRMGFVAIPNKDDLVLVNFLHGDVHSAVITARLYSDADRAPQASARECVYVSPDDAESGVRRFYMELPNGNKLLLDDDKLELEMGKTKISVKHDGDLSIESEAKITLKSRGDASLESQGNLKLKATGDVTIEGSSVSAKGSTGATLDGGSTTTVKGASISIAGQTSFSAA